MLTFFRGLSLFIRFLSGPAVLFFAGETESSMFIIFVSFLGLGAQISGFEIGTTISKVMLEFSNEKNINIFFISVFPIVLLIVLFLTPILFLINEYILIDIFQANLFIFFSVAIFMEAICNEYVRFAWLMGQHFKATMIDLARSVITLVFALSMIYGFLIKTSFLYYTILMFLLLVLIFFLQKNHGIKYLSSLVPNIRHSFFLSIRLMANNSLNYFQNFVERIILNTLFGPFYLSIFSYSGAIFSGIFSVFYMPKVSELRASFLSKKITENYFRRRTILLILSTSLFFSAAFFLLAFLLEFTFFQNNDLSYFWMGVLVLLSVSVSNYLSNLAFSLPKSKFYRYLIISGIIFLSAMMVYDQVQLLFTELVLIFFVIQIIRIGLVR